jgi:glutamine---fructose-6-phosphate transaminase (isomerizing)
MTTLDFRTGVFMCGIAGYLGPKAADSVLIVALERLKYRGYDSAGMAIVHDGDIHLRRASGKLKALADKIEQKPLEGHCGIAHTRWATHGAPTETNCHPHMSQTGNLAVVHNGIIENHDTLRKELQQAGCVFQSETDTEVIPHLLATMQKEGVDLLETVRLATARLVGSFAFAVVHIDQPRRIIAVRQGSPLLVGRGRSYNSNGSKGEGTGSYSKNGSAKEMMLASDVPALLPHAHQVCFLDDGDIADITDKGLTITTFAGEKKEAHFKAIEVSAEAVSKGDHDSFMSKEIAEQPSVLARLLDSRLRGDEIVEPDLGIDLKAVQHVVFLACGTSWHAALLGKRFLEQLARIHVEVDISSEYRYRNPVASGGTLVVAISQSGETADTLAGLRLARAKFIPVVALVNVVTSTIARESNGVMPLMAGPEIGVASTKAYTAQVLALYLFALQMAKAKGLLSREDELRAINAARQLPKQVQETLTITEEAVSEAADLFASAAATVFLGRLGEHPTALEGALKLKEIAYVHAIGYPAGEFTHGPIALVTQHLPVVCLCPKDAMYEKMLSNLQEVRARSGRIITVGEAGDRHLLSIADHHFGVRVAADELLQPILSILPLQRYAYHVATRRNCDVDQPRNLAKSVTVE